DGTQNSGRYLASASKARIERAVRVVTDQSEIIIRPGITVACRDDLAVRLDRDREGFVDYTQKISRHLAGAPKARIERAVRIVTDQSEIIIRPVISVACRDDLAIRLDRDRVGLVDDTPNSGRYLAGAPKARIERAVRIVTDQG